LYSNLSYNEARALESLALLRIDNNPLSNNLKSRTDAIAKHEKDGKVIKESKVKCSKCPSGWEHLIDFEIPNETYKALYKRIIFDLAITPFNTWRVQKIESASGDKINLDFYPVKITRLPKI
jgi:hypothetical protein